MTFEPGDVVQGREIGLSERKWVLTVCPDGTQERWTVYRAGRGFHRTCQACNLEAQKRYFSLPGSNK